MKLSDERFFEQWNQSESPAFLKSLETVKPCICSNLHYRIIRFQACKNYHQKLAIDFMVPQYIFLLRGFKTTNTYMMIRSNIYKENYKLRPIFCKNTENYLILSAVCLRYLLRKNLWSTSESFGSVFQLNLGFKNLRIR